MNNCLTLFYFVHNGFTIIVKVGISSKKEGRSCLEEKAVYSPLKAEYYMKINASCLVANCILWCYLKL